MLHITQAEKEACYILQRLGKIHVTYYTGWERYMLHITEAYYIRHIVSYVFLVLPSIIYMLLGWEDACCIT